MSKFNSKNNYTTRIKTDLQVGGKVGIKTTNPQFQLDVSGAARIQTGVTTNNVNLTGSLFQNGTVTPSLWTTNTNGSIYYTSGNVSVGTSDPQYTLNAVGPISITTTKSMIFSTSGTLSVTGDANISGNMVVFGTKNFLIQHPDPSKPNSILRHSLLEGPTRGDNVYRYEISTENKQGIVSLPDYFGFLNENVDVYISAVNVLGYGTGTYDKESNSVRVLVSDDGLYNVLVIGTRCDTGARSFDELGVEYIQ